MDKDWRPANWQLIKHNIINETPVVFSPSAGYSKDQKDQIMEKAAEAVLKELLDAGLICSPEQGSGETKPAWFGTFGTGASESAGNSPQPNLESNQSG